MKRVTLVGCGNIGSRHLQALVKLPFEADIQIVDPNENSKKLAKSRLNEIDYKKSNFIFSWHTSLDNIQESDFVILATNSTNRVELMEKLLEMGNSRFLLEKIVCQSEFEFEHLLSIINSKNAKAWVNTPRRYFDSYQKIKNKIENNQRINLIVNSGNNGLGTNAIHFVDLFFWLTNYEDMILNGDFLDERLLPNKRGTDLKEFSGTITGKSSGGSTLSINFLSYENLQIFVNIFSEKDSLVIDETNEKIYDLRTQNNSEFKIGYQSTLTTKIAKDILEKDKSLLPTLKESKTTHYELFRIFNSHIKKITNLEVEKCPIT